MFSNVNQHGTQATTIDKRTNKHIKLLVPPDKFVIIAFLYEGECVVTLDVLRSLLVYGHDWYELQHGAIVTFTDQEYKLIQCFFHNQTIQVPGNSADSGYSIGYAGHLQDYTFSHRTCPAINSPRITKEMIPTDFSAEKREEAQEQERIAVWRGEQAPNFFATPPQAKTPVSSGSASAAASPEKPTSIIDLTVDSSPPKPKAMPTQPQWVGPCQSIGRR